MKDIFAEMAKDIVFTPVDKTLHEGFADDDLRICFFTDHQIFDRFHKYNLKSDKARSGKMALTLKEIQQFEIGDYVVHVDHGVGKFGGLVRMPQGDSYQEMIKITYQHGDSIYVSIHSLYTISMATASTYRSTLYIRCRNISRRMVARGLVSLRWAQASGSV